MGRRGRARGYIVIAPEYNLPGLPRDYRFTTSEHAAVEIALRDARKRFAIDSNRVYLGGVLMGGRMAWDFGLAHPDLFAGVASVSGMPEKYAYAYKDNAKLVPFYAVLGDLAPAESEVIQPFVLGLMTRTGFDVTYVEYHKRGLEDLPEEAAAIFDWMEVHKRDPYPREFQAATAREGDDRFFGVVVREFAPQRALPPDQVDTMGKNLKPATIDVKFRELANLIDVNIKGLARVDLWLGPPHLDLSKRFEIRINGKAAFKGTTKLDPTSFLEDLRLRGDRQQVYWLRYAASLNGNRAR